MIKLKSFWIACMALLILPGAAYADFFSVGAGVPMNRSFSSSDMNNATVDKVSGSRIFARLPFLLGFAVDSVKTTLGDTTSTSTNNLQENYYSVYYTLPIPLIEIGFGAGVGSSEITNSSYYKKGTGTLTYLTVGYSFGLVALHYGLHNVSMTLPGDTVTVSGTSVAISDVNISGKYQSLNLSIGF